MIHCDCGATLDNPFHCFTDDELDTIDGMNGGAIDADELKQADDMKRYIYSCPMCKGMLVQDDPCGTYTYYSNSRIEVPRLRMTG